MKERIDVFLSKKMNLSRNKIKTLICEDKVFVCEKPCNKCSFMIDENDKVEVKEHKEYVSRGAYKLLGAIEKFGIDFSNKVVLDLGASTGGFTQVALEHGAKKVYAVDVGSGELDKTLALDKRVVNMEKRDVRSLNQEEIADCQIVVSDLSFISLKHILPKIKEILGILPLILLFKPQFECGKEIAKKFKGVIKDKNTHVNLLNDFINKLEIYNFYLSGLTYSPIKGKEGNIEYLFYLNGEEKTTANLKEIVLNAFETL